MQNKHDNLMNFELTKEKLELLINNVINGIPEDWPTIYKIRYIYLEIGKQLYKDVDFFFSADGKLGEANLGISELKEIYEHNIGRTVNTYLRVICKSASYILKMAYSKIGIKSELVETNTTVAAIYDEETFLIYHWFLAIHDNDKIYFATLTPDLPYIQMNMDTRHFASDIPYKRNYNGKIMQIYKGEEIKHSVLSREELKEIDIAIGYINQYYHYNDKAQLDKEWFLQYSNASLYILRDKLRDNKLFYELEIQETTFYKSLITFTKHVGKKFSFLEDDVKILTEKDWNYWLKVLSGHVFGRITDILGYEKYALPSLENEHWNYESWFFHLCVLIQDDLFLHFNHEEKDNFSDIEIDVENFKYNKWSKKIKSRFHITSNQFDYDNILVILDKMNAIYNCIKNNRKNGKLNELFSSLAYHFINPTHLYENNISENGYLSNYYIANKFNKLFREVFQCNDTITDFNQMGYSEKVTILKEILMMMFPEITKSNSYLLKEYNDNYNAIFNRIQLYPIKNKNDGYYSILFNILGDSKGGDYYFFYNTKKNTFHISNVLDIYSDYIIVSNRMKNRVSIDDLEKIDEPVAQEKKSRK